MASIALLALLPAGCATVTRDESFAPVRESARDATGKDVHWIRDADDQAKVDARIAQLLANPLGVEDAVQIALLGNKGLQASFAQIGLARSDLLQASRLPNPGFSGGVEMNVRKPGGHGGH